MLAPRLSGRLSGVGGKLGSAGQKSQSLDQSRGPVPATIGRFASNLKTLSAVAARIEATLDRELSDEQFITAILADVNHDGSQIDMINCGHPRPLQLGPKGPRLLGPADGTLPLGFGALANADRLSFTITLQADETVLFYTDGLSEARRQPP